MPGAVVGDQPRQRRAAAAPPQAGQRAQDGDDEEVGEAAEQEAPTGLGRASPAIGSATSSAVSTTRAATKAGHSVAPRSRHFRRARHSPLTSGSAIPPEG